MITLPGTYKARVEKHWFTTSQAGTPGLAVKVLVADADSDWGDEQAFVGTIWLSPKAMGMARSQLKALGFDCDLHDLDELESDVSLVGREVEVELKEETYKNRTELRIARFGGQAPKPTPDALAKATAALRAAKKYHADADDQPPVAEPAKPLTAESIDAEVEAVTQNADEEIPF